MDKFYEELAVDRAAEQVMNSTDKQWTVSELRKAAFEIFEYMPTPVFELLEHISSQSTKEEEDITQYKPKPILSPEEFKQRAEKVAKTFTKEEACKCPNPDIVHTCGKYTAKFTSPTPIEELPSEGYEVVKIILGDGNLKTSDVRVPSIYNQKINDLIKAVNYLLERENRT